MSVRITEKCTACGACLWECPTQAILPGDPRPVVNQRSCTECYGFFGESQCVVVCQPKAIEVVQEDVSQLRSRFRELDSDRPLQDTWIWHRT